MTKKKSIIGAMLLLVAFAVSAIAGGSSNSADFTITSGNLTAYIGTDTTVYVPDDTTTISAGAFNNTAIDVIYLPTTITTVEDNAFANCSADVKIIFEMASPTSALPSGMENWGVANAGGQITTYTTSGITTYTLSDVSAIANTTKYAYIKDGGISNLLDNESSIAASRYDVETITYTNTGNVGNNAVDVSKDGNNSVMMWEDGLNLYFWFDGDELVMPESMEYYYYVCTLLVDIYGMSKINTSQVTTMKSMFQYCSELKNIDLSNFDTSKVTSMQDMFNYCESIESIDLSSFDTSNVTNMLTMFRACRSAESINITGWDTSNVSLMSGLFYACESIEHIDASSLNTSKVSDMSQMFYECYSLKKVDVSSFDTSNVYNFDSMFSECFKLESIDISTFKFSPIALDFQYDISMWAMFGNCNSISSIKMPDSSFGAVCQSYAMFFNCQELKTIDLSAISVFLPDDLTLDDGTLDNNMFWGSDNLETVYVRSEQDKLNVLGTLMFPSTATVIVKP